MPKSTEPIPDSAQWWNEVAQGLGVTIHRERELYRGTLVHLLALCDADPCPLAERIRKYVNQTLREKTSASSQPSLETVALAAKGTNE